MIINRKYFGLSLGILSIVIAFIAMFVFYGLHEPSTSFYAAALILFIAAIIGIIFAIWSVFYSFKPLFGLFGLALNISILLTFPS